MKTLAILLCSLLLAGGGFAQAANNDTKQLRPKLVLRGGPIYTSQYTPFFVFYTCFEGCWPEEQNGVGRKTLNVGLAYPLSDKAEIAVHTGYSEFGYREVVVDGWSGERREVDRNWKFWGLEVEHRRTMYAQGKMGFVLGNALRIETPFYQALQGEETHLRGVMRRVSLSYNLRPGLEYRLNETISFSGNALFKTAVLSYDRNSWYSDSPGFNRYRPFALGIEVGLKMDIKPRSSSTN